MSRTKPSYVQNILPFWKGRGRRTLGTSLMIIGLCSPVAAQVQLYKYRLEESHDKGLCVHMTQLFNRSFKTPWDKGHLELTSNPVFFTQSYDQVFERLPGVEYSKDFVFEMLLAKHPSSPEFDAVEWREGRVYLKDSLPPAYKHPRPMLVAEIDIDNDGKKEWVVKSSFMQRVPTNSISGVGDTDFSGWDDLTIFPAGGLDLTIPLASEQLTHGQRPGYQPRMIDNEVALQLRPFIYHGKIYLSAYQVVWNDKRSSQIEPQHCGIYPVREYLNILRVVAGGRNPHNAFIETANTEIICRIRMIMLNDTTASKVN